MTERADLGDGDDLEMEEDAFQTHDTTESFFNSGSTVLTDLWLQGSVANDDVTRCGIIPLRPGLGERRRLLRGSTRRGRDALIEAIARACEKGEAHWPVTRSRPVVCERERPVTG